MTRNANSLKNLEKGRVTPDNKKDSKVTTIHLEIHDLDWLRTQPHSLSYNVRQAVRMYRKAIEEQEAQEQEKKTA